MRETVNQYVIFSIAGGYCGIAWSNAGIKRFQLPETTATATERNLLRRLDVAEPGVAPAEIANVINAVQRYFDGEQVDFSALSLDLAGQSSFFRDIYAATRKIGWGTTTTYGALAQSLGAGPEAARDVGQAMAKNPVALIIPCHRVLAAGGKLGGFSAPGGAIAKKRMLELEGVSLAPAKPTQQSFAF